MTGSDRQWWRTRGGRLAVLLFLAAVGMFVASAQHSGHPEARLVTHNIAAERVPTVTVPVTGDAFDGCTSCHSNLDAGIDERAADGLTYDHAKHFDKGEADCGTCHSARVHDSVKTITPTMKRCEECHGLDKDAKAPMKCEECHPKSFELRPKDHLTATYKSKDHAHDAQQPKAECGECHTKASCDKCHGLDMPHPDGFKKSPHVTSYFQLGAANCQNCHKRAPNTIDDCDKCHHKEGPTGVPWTQSHQKIVKDNGSKACFRCHVPATCKRCHLGGSESYDADKQNFQLGMAARLPDDET